MPFRDHFLTPTILLAVALLIALCALGAIGCFVLRFSALQRQVTLGMHGSFITDGIQALLYGTAALWLLHYRRRLQRIRQGGCLHCGYDLRASKERCPECGTPVPTSAPMETKA